MNQVQLNAVLRGLPLYASPTVNQLPYVATETRVGDTVFSAPADISPGYPGPLTVSSNLVVDGVTKALGYVVQPDDVGKTLQRSDAPSNTTGAATPALSPTVLIQAVQSFNDIGYFGGNVDNALDSNTNRLLLNAALEGRSDGGGIIGSNGYAPYNLDHIGNDLLGDPASTPSGTLTITTGSLTAGSSVTLSMTSGVGTSALAGDDTDVGRTIYFSFSPSNSATITAKGSTTSCTATLNQTQTSSTFFSGAWYITQPPLVFGATSGNTTMRITTTGMSFALTGGTGDVYKRFFLSNGVSALVTQAIDTQNCLVTIQGGTLPSLIVAGKLWSVGPDLDSNGWPRCPTTNVYSASFAYAGQYSEGLLAPSANLPDGVYHWTVKSKSASIAPYLNGQVNCSITTPTTPVDDGTGTGTYVTYFDLTVGPSKLSTSLAANVGRTLVPLFFNQAITFADCPRDGSRSSVGKPKFYQPAMAHYSQFTYLRFMDFLNTNGNTGGNWLDRLTGHNSWEFFVEFANAIAAYPGSKLKKVHICTPPFAGLDYIQSLRDWFVTAGLNPTLTLIIERGNEEWNTQFKMFYNDRNNAYAEVQAVSSPSYNGGTPLISSVVGDGTNVTVTLAQALPAYITNGASFIAATITNGMGVWNKGSYAAPSTLAGVNVGAQSFTYQNPALGSLRVTNYTGDSQLTFVSTAAGSNVAVSSVNDTFNVADIGLVLVAGGVKCNITGVTDSKHAAVTIPTGGVASSTFAAGGWSIAAAQFAVYFGTTSTLLAGGNTNLFQTVYWLHARMQYQASQLWKTVRPQDKFLISGQINNTSSVLTASKFYGGNDATWAYGMVVAPYNTPQGATVDAVFASMDTNYTSLVAQMKSHITTCKVNGIRPMCYEGGLQFFDTAGYVPDHNVQYAAQKDTRMHDQMQKLWKAWLQMGGQDWAHYQVSPYSFYFFGAMETFDDTASQKLVGIQDAANTLVSYVENTAADSTNLSFSSTNGQYSAINGSAGGILYPYSNIQRYYLHNITINRGRRYKFVVEGSTNTTNDTVTISVDGANLGTLTLAKNGTASGATTVAGVSVDPSASFVAEMTSGYHVLRIDLNGTAANGYKRVTFVPV